MLKNFMASALILTSTLSAELPATAQIQQSLQETSSEFLVANLGYGYVCNIRDAHGYLNLRSGPGRGYERYDVKLRNGNGSSIVSTSHDGWYKWYKVVDNRRNTGWVRGDYVCFQ